jgi:hypothetical protein
MGLNDIQLPPIVVCNLYKDCLIDMDYDTEKSIEKSNKIKFLGGNRRHILLLVDDADISFLPNDQLDFLSGILSACRLNMSDVGIVNLNALTNPDRPNIPDFMDAEIVILFGIESLVLGLPFKIPDFQVQQFKNRTYLFVPRLNAIKNNTDLKRKFWESLKNIFSL